MNNILPSIVGLLVVLIGPGTASGFQHDAAETENLFGRMNDQLQLPGAEERLRLLVGRSLVINSPEVLKRVSVTNDRVASAVIISPNQVLIHGVSPGTVTLLLWNESESFQSFDLKVEFDIASLQKTISQALPDEAVRVGQSEHSIVLTGTVSSPEIGEQVMALAKTRTESVVNLLGASTLDTVVLLQVRFAEVDRAALQELGVNIFSTGATNSIGRISTTQFPTVGGNVDLSSVIGAPLQGFTSEFTLTELLNVFVFRPDLNLGVAIKALEQKSLLQILAEPNLMAISGKEASFLAGGEFPFPVVQGGTTGFTAVTIQFKEFGIRLKFMANVMGDGTIHLKVNPEVSALDFTNALTVSGFLVPALSTRRAETEVQLRDGQSFAIAGLIDKRLTEVAQKIPGLGDIPILGNLFKSRTVNKTNSGVNPIFS